MDTCMCDEVEAGVEESFRIQLPSKDRIIANWWLGPKPIMKELGIRKRLENDDFQVLAEFPFGTLGYDYEEGLKFEVSSAQIKDLVAYLRAVAYPHDEVSLKRILNVPSRGIGKKAAEYLDAFKGQRRCSFDETLRQAGSVGGLTPRVTNKIKEFYSWLTEVRKAKGRLGVRDMLEKILAKTDYVGELEREKTIEAQARIENIQEFFSVIADYEEIQGTKGWFDMSTYLLVDIHDEKPASTVIEALKAIVLSIWDNNASLSFSDVSLDSKSIFKYITRKQFKPQKMHVTRLVSYVNTPVQRLPVISALEVPIFSVPSIDLIDNEIDVGWTVFGGRRLNRIGLRPEWFREHIAVIGATGTGKTTLVKKLICELSTKTHVPWWIFDVKGSEYSDLDRLGDVVVLRPGLDKSFVINLLGNDAY